MQFTVVESAIENMAVEASMVSSSAPEAGNILGVPQSLVQCILHGDIEFVSVQIAVTAPDFLVDTSERYSFAIVLWQKWNGNHNGFLMCCG